MDRLGQLTLDKLSLDKMKNMVGEVRDTIAPRNETEKRVYEALSNKNWGASSTLLNDIARDTYDFEKYGMILPLIWNALQSPSREWRKVFKSLSLLEHLVKNGAERVIEDARDNLHRVRMLSDFNYYEGPVDKGSGVREKSKQLIDLLKDNELIREEREKARKLRDKYVGLGSGGGFSGGGYSGGYGGSYSSGGGGYGGDRYGNGPSRYGDSSYSSGGGGYNDRSGGYNDRYSDRGGGYSDSADRDGSRGGYGYSDSRDEDKDKFKDKSKDTEKEQEPSSSSSSSSKPKRDRKKSSGPKLAIKIKDKDKDKDKSSSAETPAAPAPVPDLLGGDLLTTEPTPAPASIPVPATTGGQLGDLFSAPVAAAPAGGGSGNVGLDSFDPRAGRSTGTASATTTGGFGHDFVGFAPSPAPVPVTTPVPAFPVTGGATAFGATADPFAATPVPVLSGGSSFPGVMNRTNSANNGADEFSDFQSSGPTLTTTASSGETGSGGGMTNGGTASAPGGITNPKWRDVSSLVDLGGLSSNTDKKAAQQKQEEQTFQSNNNSFAGLDGFHTKPQGMATARPPAGPTGLSGGVHGVGMMSGGMGFQQQQAMRGGLMGAQQGMTFPQQQQQQQQAFGTQGMGMGMGMGMGGMPGQQMGAGMSMGMGMGMQQGGGTMGSKRGMQAGAAAGAGGAVMPGGFTGTGASGSFF